MKKRKMCLLILCCLCCFSLFAQTNENKIIYPEAGKPCPDFVLRNIRYYSKKEATLADFKGKWLVLDFWNKNCGSCVASFPKTSAMQKEFQGQVQIMLVGDQDKENIIQPMYAKYKMREHLLMPCAFDSVLCKQWDIYTAPHYVIIDDKGIVRGVTNHIQLQDIRDFLAGKIPELNRTYRFESDTVSDDVLFGMIPYDRDKPFMVNNNGANDTDFMFRSILAKFNPKVQHDDRPDIGDDVQIRHKERLNELGLTLTGLYNLAYCGEIQPGAFCCDTTFGKYWRMPVLELKDTSLFVSSYKGEGINLFSYSVTVPVTRASKAFLETCMQHDLANYFGYRVKIETRECPCWKLIATDKARGNLKTKGGNKMFDYPHTTQKLIMVNYPMSDLILLMYNALPGQIIIKDETGIKSNIDISLNCIISNIDDLRSALKANGLDLVRGETPMKVLVISDEVKP